MSINVRYAVAPLLALCWHLALTTEDCRGQDAPRTAAASAPLAAEPAPPRSPNYQLSAGDVVNIRVFREPDLDSQQRISQDGTINFPLLGIVKIAGRTTNEAASLIATLLDKDYVVRPQVSVAIAVYNKTSFTVLGQVNNPGSFLIPEEQSIDLLSAIARAGGFTRLAKPSAVVVRRLVNGREDAFTVNVDQLMRDKKSARVMIQPNDTISVPERFF